jgi:hypothetical protein
MSRIAIVIFMFRSPKWYFPFRLPDWSLHEDRTLYIHRCENWYNEFLISPMSVLHPAYHTAHVFYIRHITLHTYSTSGISHCTRVLHPAYHTAHVFYIRHITLHACSTSGISHCTRILHPAYHTARVFYIRHITLHACSTSSISHCTRVPLYWMLQ